jgi:hypothetical protein
MLCMNAAGGGGGDSCSSGGKEGRGDDGCAICSKIGDDRGRDDGIARKYEEKLLIYKLAVIPMDKPITKKTN